MLYVDIIDYVGDLELECRSVTVNGYQVIEIPGRDRTLFYPSSRHVRPLLRFAAPYRQKYSLFLLSPFPHTPQQIPKVQTTNSLSSCLSTTTTTSL